MSGDRRLLRVGLATGPPLALLASLVCALAGFLTAPTLAQDTAPPPHVLRQELAEKLRRPGDLMLAQTPLPQALLIISDKWEIDIVVGQEVEGTVNGKFTNAPLHEILHTILHVNGYGYRIVGGSLAVMKLENLGDVNPLFESSVIKLQAADSAEVVEGAKLLLSPQGKIQAVSSANCLLVIDLPERIGLVNNFARDMDAAASAASGGSNVAGPMEVAQFAPQFIEAASVLESAQSLLSKEGKASVILAENRLVVADYPSGVARVRELLRQIDVPRPQVRITALVYDVSREDLERLGVNWSHSAKNRINGSGEAQSLWSLGSVMQMPAAAGDPTSVMTFMNLSRHIDLTTVIHALDQMRDSRLLMNPMVAVRNRETASFAIVTEVPYQQLVQTEAGGNIGTTAFREAGVTLKVTPYIAKDGTIQLDVNPIFSRLTGFTSGTNPQPIIDKRETQTSVRVANSQTLVIGGLRQRSDVNDFRAIPGLSDLKYKWFHIGKLFQSQDNSMQESELIVFVTPEIITPFDCGLPRERHSYHSGNLLLDQIPPLQLHMEPHGQIPAGEPTMMQQMPPGHVEMVPPHAAPPEAEFPMIHPSEITPLEVPPPSAVPPLSQPAETPAPAPQRSSRRQANLASQTVQPGKGSSHQLEDSSLRVSQLMTAAPRPRLLRLPPVHQETVVQQPLAPLGDPNFARPPESRPEIRTANGADQWMWRIFSR